jgi:small subunit ribosomal protein S4
VSILFFSRPYAARQLVGHGHVRVDGRRVDIPSYRVRVGQVLSLRPRSRRIPQVAEAWESADIGAPVAYLTRSKPEYAAALTSMPSREQIPVICEIPQVIEFYSK